MRTGRAIITAAGVVGAGATAALVGRQVQRSGWAVARERARRSRRVLSLAVKRGLVFGRLRLRGGSEAEMDEFHLHTAEQVFALLGGMKGAIMKLGQLVSFIAEGMPDVYQEALRGLQQQAPPMAPHLVAEVIRAELGREPLAVFDEFSAEPVAAASIGQVHRARLFDGTSVAVKVQYPGVDIAIRADLDNALGLNAAARMLAPAMDARPIVAELKERMGEELDYRIEADNQRHFRAGYDGHPWARVPAVVDDCSTARVLTTEWAQGASFYDLLGRSQAERDRAGEQLFRWWVGSVARLGRFNGDPHPGNYFFAADGRVWFLDFGMCKRFATDDVARLRDRIAALRTGDVDTVFATMVDHGWLPADAPVDPKRAADLARVMSLSLLEHRPYTHTRDQLRQTIESLFNLNGLYTDVLAHLTVPRDQLILTRIQIGLGALLARLGATRDWASIVDEYLFGAPPSTPMGEQVAGWPLSPTAVTR